MKPHDKPARASRSYVDVKEFMTELGIARSTFDDWRAKGSGPRWFRLPNGQLRCRRSDLEEWIESLEEAA